MSPKQYRSSPTGDKKVLFLRVDETTYNSLSNTASAIGTSVNYVANDALAAFVAQVEDVEDRDEYQDVIDKLGGKT